jgi:Flp pilus assembly protein TadD
LTDTANIPTLFRDADQHHRAGRLDQAENLYRRLAAIPGPHIADACNNLGAVLGQQGQRDEAVAWLRKSLNARPDFLQAQGNLARALQELGRTDEAVACFRTAVQLDPSHIGLRLSLGNALAELGQWDAAQDCFAQVLTQQPNHAPAHNDKGHALRMQGQLDAAIACFRRAVALAPEDAQTHLNLAMALLARGDFAEGWAEYEWRWRTPQGLASARRFAQPPWRGEPGEGRTLLIHAEQGYGDTVQFCRYAELAAVRGWRVVLGVQRPLVRLMRGVAGVAAVVGPNEDLPDFDRHCPMLGLPLLLRAIPCADAYLRADTAQAAVWAARLRGGDGLRVGLVWAGSRRPHAPLLSAVDRRRSIAPERLAPLFAVRGARFFSLQKVGPPMPAEFPVSDFMAEMDDFADTAALVANLDLIVSVDTAVAHLAAAMGKPVWLLDRFDTCWRWLAGRQDSPWYPSLRIHRQPRYGDWDPVIAQVAAALQPLRPTRPAGRCGAG